MNSDITKYKVIYFQPSGEEDNLSQQDLIKCKKPLGTLYLSKYPSKSWGDDWNDCPSSCNSGTPYDNREDGLIVIELFYGKPINMEQL